MNKLAPLFAAIALVSSGGVAADTGGSSPAPSTQAPSTGDANSSTEAKKPEGFVLLQRNIYVPVDSEGKVASSQLVVIEKRGFVTPEEFEVEARNASKDTTKDDEATGKEDEAKPGESTTPPLGRSSRSRDVDRSLGEGPLIAS